MSDPFNILGPEFETPPAFDLAVRDRVTRIGELTASFEEMAGRIPDEAYSDQEWKIVESAALAIEEASERAEEGYVAVMYDSHAWYRIMESFEQIERRLASALGVMELVEQRLSSPPPDPSGAG